MAAVAAIPPDGLDTVGGLGHRKLTFLFRLGRPYRKNQGQWRAAPATDLGFFVNIFKWRVSFPTLIEKPR